MKKPVFARILLLLFTIFFQKTHAQDSGIPVNVSFGRYASENGGCLGGRGICSFATASPTSKNAVLYELENGIFRLVVNLETLPESEKEQIYRQNNLRVSNEILFIQEEKISLPASLFHSTKDLNNRNLMMPIGNLAAQITRTSISIDFKPIKTTAP